MQTNNYLKIDRNTRNIYKQQYLTYKIMGGNTKEKKSSKPKNRSKSKKTITIDVESDSDSSDGMTNMLVYTDGSCSQNGKPGAIGGIGIYFPNKELPSVSKIFPLNNCTSQRTELYAILTTLRYIKSHFDMKSYKICIKTDSEYSINCLTKWVFGWVKRDWLKQNGEPVLNKELIETIFRYLQKYQIIFKHVSAHTRGTDKDSRGNAEADRLATSATALAIEKRKKLQNKSNSTSNSKSARRSGSKSNAKPQSDYKSKSDYKPNYKSNSNYKSRDDYDPNYRSNYVPNPKYANPTSKYSVDNLVIELVKSK